MSEGVLQLSSGRWHGDTYPVTFMYQVSDPELLNPTEFLLPVPGAESELKDLLDYSQLRRRDELVNYIMDDLDEDGAQYIYRAASGDFTVLTEATLHRSTPTITNGRRYFMRWSFHNVTGLEP